MPNKLCLITVRIISLFCDLLKQATAVKRVFFTQSQVNVTSIHYMLVELHWFGTSLPLK